MMIFHSYVNLPEAKFFKTRPESHPKMAMKTNSRRHQKMARSKGFVLDALHGFWDVHHQQRIHRTAGRRQTRTSHRFDAVQDLPSGESADTSDTSDLLQ
jgi:hypothetical protein